MKRTDILNLAYLFLAVAIIYAPLFYTQYLYTDEALQVWLSHKGLNITSIPQGRYLTYRLFTFLFSYINTVHGVMYARLFSLTGWLICLPIWYYIIKNAIVSNGLPTILIPFTLTYLVSIPGFTISVGWAACLELFIACTAGLLSGFVLYRGIAYKNEKPAISILTTVISIVCGVTALFIYQNGFGCFFIPFFIKFIADKRCTKKVFIGIVFSLLIYGLYYLMFKYSLQIAGMQPDNRALFSANPFKKLIFLFTLPMAAAFHFTWLVKEKSLAGEASYLLLLSVWFAISLIRQKRSASPAKIYFFAGVIVFFILIYLPSLLVVENYASNRTLLALNLAVFILVAETIFSFIKNYGTQYSTAAAMGIFFLLNAWYNFHRQFLLPVADEYRLIKNFVYANYTDRVKTIYFIQPPVNAFEIKYNTVASWDEFGVPSTTKPWVPEPLVKQIIFEKTGSRILAENILVKTWPGQKAFVQSGLKTDKTILLVNVESMLATQQ